MVLPLRKDNSNNNDNAAADKIEDNDGNKSVGYSIYCLA